MVAAVVMVAYAAARMSSRHFAKPRETRWELVKAPSGAADTLVVMVHGLPGRRSLRRAEQLVAETLPNADRLIFDYDGNRITNLDPYEVANIIELKIYESAPHNAYARIVLLGHSAGAALLRKAFVWAHGHEEDRARVGLHGKRAWVDCVDRFVLLAGLNRGWSISPKPAQMSTGHYLWIGFGQVAARLFGIGRFAMAMRSGAPFIADTRVQWVKLIQEIQSTDSPFPTVIQLIGSKDDIVSREDGQDLCAARGTLFITLPETGHEDIGGALDDARTPGAKNRLQRIAEVLSAPVGSIEPDQSPLPPEDRSVTRIVYILHGIRDYGHWTDVLRKEVARRCLAMGENVAVVNMKYGYFPMLAFMTHSDRQRNVRRFMDQYTEDLARYPNARIVDFAGHSNGTYILASALQHYATMRVRRVYFAGSVVPNHYPWTKLIDAGRVERVANVVATADWVVAIFPKVFEQIAYLRKVSPATGWLDLGAAGFRGFLESAGSLAVNDLKFSPGQHSTGVDISNRSKLDAIAGYLALGKEDGLDAFCMRHSQNRVVNLLSNISLPLMLGLILILVCAGAFILMHCGGWWLLAYALFFVIVLNLV